MPLQRVTTYQGLSKDEARRWMLLGNADEVCRQVEAFAAEVMPRFR